MLMPLIARALVALAPVAGAGRAATDTIPSDSVIAHYYAAIGGHSALLADTTLSFSGHYQEGDFKVQTTILWKRPTFRRVSVVLPEGFAYVELFDGRDEWEFTESFNRPVQHDTGASERAGRRGAEFDESFVDYRAKGPRVQARAASVIEGRAANVLRVTLRDGWVKDYYFDVETGLLVALRKAMPLHASGADVVSLTYFRDYKRIGAVLRPLAQEERNVATGALMNTLRWDSITPDVSIRPEAFVHPGSRRETVDGPPSRKSNRARATRGNDT
ncbi:MAG: hypothetical protein H0U66_16085 [Gemmatimonadaceae bacterium]|nr:hypothetical protein [Gemmatimonadaceae bacterium]